MQLYESAFVIRTTTSINARFETMENDLFIRAKQQVMNVIRLSFKQPLMWMKSVAKGCQSYLKLLQSESQMDFSHVCSQILIMLGVKVGNLIIQFAALNVVTVVVVISKDENELVGEILKSPMGRCLVDIDLISSLGGRQEQQKDLITHCLRKDLNLDILNFQY